MKTADLRNWLAGLWNGFVPKDEGTPASDGGEETAAGAARRSFLKTAGVVTAAPMILTSRKSEAQVAPLIIPPSPATVPWVEELPNAITPIRPVASLTPNPTGIANTVSGECGRDTQQRWDDFFGQPELPDGAADLYEIRAKENPAWVFNPAYPAQAIWGFAGNSPDATTPGPTFFARYGRPIICRIRNELPQDHVGFGTPEITTHLHNLHTPSASDGFPGDFFSPIKAGPTLTAPGAYRDHFYPNIYAGYDTSRETDPSAIGDPREALGTLWYHDHTMDFTGPNVYRGMAGFYLLFDELDSGDENDPNPNALRLPSHPYDYPLIFQDKRFDASGMLYFDQMNPEGVLGDKVTVNGKIEPVLRVAKRKYRFRLLNGGPTRFYEFYLVTPGNAVQTFTYIANDGNLLPAPLLNQTKVRLGVAERGDIVVDFSRYPVGTQLYLVNRLRQEKTRGPKDVMSPGTRLLKIIVGDYPSQPDMSRVPSMLRPLPDIPTDFTGVPVRRWKFARSNGLWTVNGKIFDVNSVRANPTRGTAEIWELENAEDGWQHPIHIHFEEGRMLSKTVKGVAVPIPPHERGRKDVWVVQEFTTLRLFYRFRDFTGKYPMHCHNLTHEDHAMMIRWDIKE